MGDRGENLSSVLEMICSDLSHKDVLLDWIRELTPMDAADFEFQSDAAGRILVTLVEKSGVRTSALSASDGTLRFLAMIAALLGPNPAGFYFFEEIDTGIHPNRLGLLVQLIEQQVQKGKVQVVTTTHSPQLLGLLQQQSLQHASIIYRSPYSPGAAIKRLLELPDAGEVIAQDGAAYLHAAGWMEDAMAFSEVDQ